jgi:hypothetical protein
MLVKVTVALVFEPAWALTLDGDTDIEKSPTCTLTVVDLVNVPFDAEKETVYGPATEEMNAQNDEPEVAVGERVMLDGLQDTDNPDDGFTVLVIVRVPLNPEVPAKVRVVFPEEPELNATVAGFAAIVKS